MICYFNEHNTIFSLSDLKNTILNGLKLNINEHVGTLLFQCLEHQNKRPYFLINVNQTYSELNSSKEKSEKLPIENIPRQEPQ